MNWGWPLAPAQLPVIRAAEMSPRCRMRSAASSWASKNAPRRPSYASVDVAEITVKVHRAAMLRKMQARTVADLVRMAATLEREGP